MQHPNSLTCSASSILMGISRCRLVSSGCANFRQITKASQSLTCAWSNCYSRSNQYCTNPGWHSWQQCQRRNWVPLAVFPMNNKDNYLQNCHSYSSAILNHIINIMEISSDSDSSHNSAEYRRIYQKQIDKLNLNHKKNVKQEQQRRSPSPTRHRQARSRSRSRDRNRRRRSRTPDGPKVMERPEQIRWYIYPRSPHLRMQGRIKEKQQEILSLPIYRKQVEILNAIMLNQFVLVTGETGCGKSTQVPRLLYEYLRETAASGKIMCVQPRRLAVLNLFSIMNSQMPERDMIGYQIGMTSRISPDNRIVFVTNGIFLQRLVHSTDFFEEYPFIILDQVHQRDIDTDFILLTLKRLIRNHPRVRIILMSATIDNELFRYYFASDHIDKILQEKNFYKKILEAQQRPKRQPQRNTQEDEEQEEEDEVEIDSDNEEALYRAYGFEFMRAKHPCPAINVTEPGKYTRTYYYLDTMHKFLREGTANSRWGGVIFSDKYPCSHKELHQTVCLILDQIENLHHRDHRKPSVLIFVPGLAEIEGLSDSLSRFMLGDRLKKDFEVIHVHSTILNREITDKLHEGTGPRIKVIISTNIAESSITVLGVKYVIDFCLSKEVRFDVRSRMENLELVWASKASCNQRAGRTGRVCNGIVFRLLEQGFYQKLQDYSTPEIQRSSLDKLILRIKLLHEGHSKSVQGDSADIHSSIETNVKPVFADPGEVLGSAIQPPNLKNIDTAIKSLQFCGGLDCRGEEFFLTELGRFYIDIPIDITYCKLLVVSLLMGTFDDIIILVSILSQSKNAVRKGNIDRNYAAFYQAMENPQACDFLGLVQLYKTTKSLNRSNRSNQLILQTFSEVNDMIRDITKRMRKKESFRALLESNKNNEIKGQEQKGQDYLLRFKLTLLCGFIDNVLKVRDPTYDQKQEKRLKLMRREGIPTRNTVCLLKSDVIRKPQNVQAQQKLKRVWKTHVDRALKVSQTNFTLTYGLSYLHFQKEQDLHKFLFYRYIQENKKNYSDMETVYDKNYLSPAQVFKCFGEMDHMQQGRPVTFCKEQTVVIDNYSLNRVINVNDGDPQKFLIANNIAKQSSRMVARYTSLLPHHIPYLHIIGHLLFYPFVHLVPNRNRTRYEAIHLKKKHRIILPYELASQQVQMANQIRKHLREHLSLQYTSQFNDSSTFQQRVVDFVTMKRQQIIEEQRWQQAYLQEIFQQHPQLKSVYSEMLAESNAKALPNDQRKNQKIFMNDIKAPPLTLNFFSDVIIGDTTAQWRRQDYNRWKREKLQEIAKIQRRALDNDSYLACGVESCGLLLAKLKKVGPINQEIYRDLFQHEAENVKEVQFNEMGSHFCTLLMSNYIESEYRTFACSAGHYFAIQLDRERRLKILPFSQLIIIYPDGTPERADFQRLEMKYWKSKHDRLLKERNNMQVSTYCFMCDDHITSFKDLEVHVRDGRHIKHVSQFKRTLPAQEEPVPMDIQPPCHQDDGY